MYFTGRVVIVFYTCKKYTVEVDTVTSNQISVNTVSRSYFTLFRSYGLYGTTLDTLEATNSRASAALNTVRLCLAAVPGRDVAAVRREPRVALHRLARLRTARTTEDGACLYLVLRASEIGRAALHH